MDTDGNQIKCLFLLDVVNGVSHKARTTPSSPSSINDNSPSTGRAVRVLIIPSATKDIKALSQIN